jgi:C-terminal processing protease CtpA/Prc
MAVTMNQDDRRQVIAGAAQLIEARYVYPDKGHKIAAALRADVARFDQADPTAFALAMTQRLRAISGDGHFAVAHRPHGQAEESTTATDEAHMKESMQRWYGVGVNHGFESVQRLEHGIGYLDLRTFAPLEMGGDLLTGAMTFLAQSPALIIDLRRNGGGMGESAIALMAYLFDESVEVSGSYDRPTDHTIRRFTPSWVPGRHFGPNKPVYLLISKGTFSAAEAFAYDLQALKRAKVVGERSGGGAHPFAYRSITPNFILSLPEGRSINPVTRGDWEGTGVIPDVETPPDETLNTALALAKAAIATK